MKRKVLVVSEEADEWRWGYDIAFTEHHIASVIDGSIEEVVMLLLGDWADHGARISIYRRKKYERKWHLLAIAPEEPLTLPKWPKELTW